MSVYSSVSLDDLSSRLEALLNGSRAELGDPESRHKFLMDIIEGYNLDFKPIPAARVDHFCIDPASARYHGSFEGGLFFHSLAVLYYTLRLFPVMAERPQTGGLVHEGFTDLWYRELIVSALFHDLCKAGSYKISTRNTKDDSGRWIQVPYYENRPDYTGAGHGGESCYRINQCYAPGLSRVWYMAVYWHMGAFGLSPADQVLFTNACKAYPEVHLLHTADMMAINTYF